MTGFTKKLQDQDDFISSKNGAKAVAIRRTEQKLGLCFAKEYKDYTQQLGIAVANVHEFTGVVEMPRLSVAQVTVEERKRNPNIPESLYVVERMGIDGIIIWQDQNGCVYMTIRDGQPEKIAQSLAEYLEI